MSIEIRTDNLLLRVPNDDDFERYWSMLNELVMWKPDGRKGKLGYSDCRDAFLKRNSAPYSDEGAEFSLLDEKGKYVGHCGFRMGEKGAEFYYNICMDSWGHGYSHEASEAALRYCFEHFSHEKYYMRVNESDAAAVKICQRLGFERSEDGIFVINRV